MAYGASLSAETSHKYDATAFRIFAYHRIGEDQYPETNIRLSQFEDHIQELTHDNYNVMALPDVLKMLTAGKSLPEKTVVLTFDGGHASIYRHAVPLLQDANLPFTLFIGADLIDSGSNEYMQWTDIKKLSKDKHITIGMHPATYQRLYTEDKQTIKHEINRGKSRIRDMTGITPTLFAYPFGEYSNTYREIVGTLGLSAAVTQNSAVGHLETDMLALPRFSMTERYGDVDRFRMLANALPLPATIKRPADPYVKSVEDKKEIVISFDNRVITDPELLSCFLSDYGRKDLIFSNESDETIVKLAIDTPVHNSRQRLNCTYPVSTDSAEQWRWYGQLFVKDVSDYLQADN